MAATADERGVVRSAAHKKGDKMPEIIFGIIGLCLFILGGRVRTVFLYVMFALCVEVLAAKGPTGGFMHFLTWSGTAFVYAICIAQNARDGGPVGKIGMWWWMLRYAAIIKLHTKCSWHFCWHAAGCAVDDDPFWQDYTPREAVEIELSYWAAF